MYIIYTYSLTCKLLCTYKNLKREDVGPIDPHSPRRQTMKYHQMLTWSGRAAGAYSWQCSMHWWPFSASSLLIHDAAGMGSCRRVLRPHKHAMDVYWLTAESCSRSFVHFHGTGAGSMVEYLSYGTYSGSPARLLHGGAPKLAKLTYNLVN